jgi:fructose-1,6-bisphosphatase
VQQYKPQKGENETIMIEHSHNQKQGSNLTAALNSILQVSNSAQQSIRNNALCKVLGSSRGQEKTMEKETNMGLGFPGIHYSGNL